ncbi:hypothetical protein AB8O38_15065 [Saccharomonospora xinjiangensis]|uniref:PE domain-containing protein n=1 Tax=Saccharomonospora xinjiangensis XJ-54 TaxID=882086 RepID=I0V1D6_9PSEU|nr:hypothetical protein [Saccharomonospora xinjiangensis]EID53939.1 hypothetical protein SacxiDRAFT_1697 [Saccharomonospora xinjiangensis XJ-54]
MAREIRGVAHPVGGAVYTPQASPPPTPPSHDLLLHRAARTDAALDEVIGDEGFAFDTETLQHLANQWADFASRYEDALSDADLIASAEGPGIEYASAGHAEKLRASGRALRDALQERIRYCEEMRDKFRAALGDHLSTEGDAETTLSKVKGEME